ncbi:hypothetical protein VNO77_19370 [Canavalia gladiata]|uniref:Uncharacterized protein n=1 Tax=Canavalia gladiata TaxID=3824 RepID=A0AAN9LMB4_CANGL
MLWSDLFATKLGPQFRPNGSGDYLSLKWKTWRKPRHCGMHILHVSILCEPKTSFFVNIINSLPSPEYGLPLSSVVKAIVPVNQMRPEMHHVLLKQWIVGHMTLTLCGGSVSCEKLDQHVSLLLFPKAWYVTNKQFYEGGTAYWLLQLTSTQNPYKTLSFIMQGKWQLMGQGGQKQIAHPYHSSVQDRISDKAISRPFYIAYGLTKDLKIKVQAPRRRLA